MLSSPLEGTGSAPLNIWRVASLVRTKEFSMDGVFLFFSVSICFPCDLMLAEFHFLVPRGAL